MAKSASNSPITRRPKKAGLRNGGTEQPGPTRRRVQTREVGVSNARFEAVMQAAERSGFLKDKSGRIGGRVSPALVKQAKRITGIETDTDLIEFALATIALEDNFAEVFKQSHGTVDPDLQLGF